MHIGQGFAKDPNSKTNPPGVVTVKVINRERQALDETRCRLAYLDEFERIQAEQAANAFCESHKFTDSQHRAQVRRAFLIAAFLRDFKDVDVCHFMTEAKSSPGEVALRRLGYPAAVKLYEQWGAWMDSEFLTDVQTGAERKPTDEEEQELEDGAAGES